MYYKNNIKGREDIAELVKQHVNKQQKISSGSIPNNVQKTILDNKVQTVLEDYIIENRVPVPCYPIEIQNSLAQGETKLIVQVTLYSM
jgi:hypothetical protein